MRGRPARRVQLSAGGRAVPPRAARGAAKPAAWRASSTAATSAACCASTARRSPGSFAGRSAKNERRLQSRGELAHVALQPQDDIARWIDDFLRIEAAGWKGATAARWRAPETNRRYATEILGAAFRRGQLIACGLDVGGRAIARRFSFTAGEAAYAFKTAYDESFARFSPGVVLELANVRQLDADPRLQWMDSFTEDENLALERLWPDRRTMQTLVAGLGAWGKLAAAALPWLRWIKHRMR